MKLIDKVTEHNGRAGEINLYPIGDVHVGAFNFASKKFKLYINKIKDDPNALFFGGGDILDAVILQDQKRFDPENLPDWMLADSPSKTRKNIKDILSAQLDYAQELLEPVKDKCIGLLEGNHEYSISHYHNRDIQEELCKRLNTVSLTDCAFIRLLNRRLVSGKSDPGPTVRVYVCHGNGGGRSAGAEPTHLARLAQERDCEIIMRGHSHCQHIMPAIPRLTIPKIGVLPEHAMTKNVRAANWGCWLLSYAQGPSTYDSRANYPVRPMCTVVANIKPYTMTSKIAGRTGKGGKQITEPRITIQEVLL